MSETFLDRMRFRQGFRTPLVFFPTVVFCLLLVHTNQLTQACHFNLNRYMASC